MQHGTRAATAEARLDGRSRARARGAHSRASPSRRRGQCDEARVLRLPLCAARRPRLAPLGLHPCAGASEDSRRHPPPRPVARTHHLLGRQDAELHRLHAAQLAARVVELVMDGRRHGRRGGGRAPCLPREPRPRELPARPGARSSARALERSPAARRAATRGGSPFPLASGGARGGGSRCRARAGPAAEDARGARRAACGARALPPAPSRPSRTDQKKKKNGTKVKPNFHGNHPSNPSQGMHFLFTYYLHSRDMRGVAPHFRVFFPRSPSKRSRRRPIGSAAPRGAARRTWIPFLSLLILDSIWNPYVSGMLNGAEGSAGARMRERGARARAAGSFPRARGGARGRWARACGESMGCGRGARARERRDGAPRRSWAGVLGRGEVETHWGAAAA